MTHTEKKNAIYPIIRTHLITKYSNLNGERERGSNEMNDQFDVFSLPSYIDIQTHVDYKFKCISTLTGNFLPSCFPSSQTSSNN